LKPIEPEVHAFCTPSIAKYSLVIVTTTYLRVI
jgi:hypothetical protein